MTGFREYDQKMDAYMKPDSDDISVFFVYNGDLFLYIADTGQKIKIANKTFGDLSSRDLSVEGISNIIDGINFRVNQHDSSAKSAYEFALSIPPILLNASFAIIIYYDGTESFLKALHVHHQLKLYISTRLIHIGALAAFGRFGLQTQPDKEEIVDLPYGHNVIECELGNGVTEIKDRKTGLEFHPIKIKDAMKGCAYYARLRYRLKDYVLLLNTTLQDIRLSVYNKEGKQKDQWRIDGLTTVPTRQTLDFNIEDSDIIDIEINGKSLTKLSNHAGVIENYEVMADNIPYFTINCGGWKFTKTLYELIHRL